MNRPEGISESAWDEAIDTLGPSNVHVYGISYPMIVERVARAIQSSVEAERARIADTFEAKADRYRLMGTVTANTFARIWDDEAERVRKGA